LWLGLLTVGLWRPAWRQPLLPWRRLALAGLTIIAVMAVRAVREELNGRTAVVIVPEAVVRYGPLEESQSQFTLRDGAEVEVLDRHADWAQIRDAQRRTGWIKTQHLILPGANGRETS
jgi:SH3-like domain-containing protein